MNCNTVDNKRITKNAIFLYVRMLFTMFISFFTSRVILEVLGVTDFGIYNVVGGITTIIVFFTGCLTNVAQRYFNLGLGQRNISLTNQFFNQFLLLFSLLALLVFVIGEGFATYIINEFLLLPEGRKQAASWVYQCSLIALSFSLVQIPYQSLVIAHEKMNVFALVSLFESILRLVILYIVQALSGDRLVLYGSLYLSISVFSFLIYALYAHAKFDECFYKYYFNKSLAKKMFKFVGYNMYGCFAFSMCQQGVNVLFNLFFGPTVNAARALSMQVYQGVFRFSDNILTAVRPPIIKLYSQNETEKMISLAIGATRYCLFVNTLLVIPIMVNVDFILHIWLRQVPDYTAVFIIIILIESNFNIANQMLTVLVNATGNLKRNQFYGRTFTLLTLPLSYIALLHVKSPVIPMLIILVSTICYWLNNIRDTHIQIQLSYKEYLTKTIVPISVLHLFLCLLSYTMTFWMDDGWMKLILTVSANVVIGTIIIYSLLMSKKERNVIRNKIQMILQKK